MNDNCWCHICEYLEIVVLRRTNKAVGGKLLKAQMQNSYEKVKCEQRKRDIAKKRSHSLYMINKRIREVENNLTVIKVSSGYFKEAQGITVVEKNPVERLEISEIKAETYLSSNMQGDKNVDISKRKTNCIIDTLNESLLPFGELSGNESHHSLQMERKHPINFNKNILLKEKACIKCYKRYETNEKLNDDGVAKQLPREDNLMQTEKWNVKGKLGTTQHSTDIALDPSVNELNSDIKGSQGTQMKNRKLCKSSVLQSANTHMNGNKDTKTKEIFLLLQKIETHEHSASHAESFKSEQVKKYPDPSQKQLTFDGSQLKGASTQAKFYLEKNSKNVSSEQKNNCTIPVEFLTRSTNSVPTRHQPVQLNMLASASSSRSKNMSSNDYRKVNIHVNLSKRERKKILQGLISNCNLPFDRSVLEKERKKMLQEKITAFFASLK